MQCLLKSDSLHYSASLREKKVMLSLSMDGSHAGTSSYSSATNLSKRRKIIQSLRGTKVRITVGKKSMRKFITGIKCRMQRAVNKSLGHKVNMTGK